MEGLWKSEKEDLSPFQGSTAHRVLPWGPSHSSLPPHHTQQPVLSKTPHIPSFSPKAAGLRPGLYREDGSGPLEYPQWPGPFCGHSHWHGQIVLCRRQESSSPALANGIRSFP